MKIQTRLRLLVIVLIAIMVIRELSFIYLNKRQEQFYFSQIIKKNEQLVDKLLHIQDENTQKFINDYTMWDELAEFQEHPDSAWASVNLNSIISNLDLSYLTVYNNKQKLLYKSADTSDVSYNEIPIFKSLIPEMFGKGRKNNFYEVRAGKLYEVFGASIVESSDNSRTGKSHGYFVIGIYIDTLHVAKLSKTLECKVSIQMGAKEMGDSLINNISDKSIRLRRELKDNNGNTVAVITFEKEHYLQNPDKKAIIRDIFLLFFRILVIFIFYILIKKWVRDPLKDLTTALHSNKPDMINPYITKNDEIGELARLIKLYNEQKELLQEQVEREQMLSEEVSLANANLHKTNEELVSLNETKDKFFSIISHDLRNPLASIVSLSNMMTDSKYEFSEEKKNKMLMMLNAASKNGVSLLTNLLDWARCQRGAIQPEYNSYSISALFGEIENMLMSELANKEIHLNIEQINDFKFYTDKNLLQTVVRNLVSNAIKFSEEKSSITLKIEQKENTVDFVIIDYGVGMEAEKVNRLFKIGETNISTRGTNEEMGTGLGLIVCQEFVQLLKGKISVESEVGKGTQFTVSLPYVA